MTTDAFVEALRAALAKDYAGDSFAVSLTRFIDGSSAVHVTVAPDFFGAHVTVTDASGRAPHAGSDRLLVTVHAPDHPDAVVLNVPVGPEGFAPHIEDVANEVASGLFDPFNEHGTDAPDVDPAELAEFSRVEGERRIREWITANHPSGDVLLVAPVLWDGWELDNRAAVVRGDDGAVFVVGSDHGQFKVLDDAGDLLTDRLRAYAEATRATHEALVLLGITFETEAGPPQTR